MDQRLSAAGVPPPLSQNALVPRPSESCLAGETPAPLHILYRGPLPSCNYSCGYCPFAKHRASDTELVADRSALTRFCQWVSAQQRQLQIFFTPWGEALVHDWYRAAMIDLGRLPQVARIVAQTNLSCRLDWIDECRAERTAFWCSYHPSQTRRERFLQQCGRLEAAGLRYSVGIVGLREHFAEAVGVRRALPRRVYLWVNAYKDVPDYYTDDEIAGWERIDPHFRWNTVRHASRGQDCRTGASVISVDGDGTVRRCHFVPQALGNLYDPDFRLPGARPCPNETCGCHIGYVHLEPLGLERVFASGILERIPAGFCWSQPEALAVTDILAPEGRLR